MLREHFKCSLSLPTGHIVGKMHMSSRCTQHVITGFQAPSSPVSEASQIDAEWPIQPDRLAPLARAPVPEVEESRLEKERRPFLWSRTRHQSHLFCRYITHWSEWWQPHGRSTHGANVREPPQSLGSSCCTSGKPWQPAAWSQRTHSKDLQVHSLWRPDERSSVRTPSPDYWSRRTPFRFVLQIKTLPKRHLGFLLTKHPPVRNMGNFNLFQTHVLTFFHHVEQCCYPSFLILPHIPAMTSHVANVIYAIIMLITTQGLCTITSFLMSFFFLCIWDRIFLMFLTIFLFFSYPCRLTHSV